jgi:hypothetical protein
MGGKELFGDLWSFYRHHQHIARSLRIGAR